MIKYKTNDYNPSEDIFPGETLAETLKAIGMTQADLALRTDRPQKTISEIINGTTAITPETAIQFERVLGIPASFWNNLEKNYQERKALSIAKSKLTHEIERAKKFPVSLMIKRKWIEACANWEEKVEKLLSFFSVNSLTLVNNVMDVAYRNHNVKKLSIEALQVWLRKGEIDGAKIQTSPYNEIKLREVVSELKSFTNKHPHDYMDDLQKKLADCGVAVVFTPSIPNTRVCGSARWLTSDKALVQLSLRGGFADIMWFTLFHELGHILLHAKKIKHIDFDDKTEISDIEMQADKFASDILIPQDKYSRFISNYTFNVSSIVSFSSSIGVHTGIVVGRLQHDSVIGFNHLNSLREIYKFKDA